MLVRHSLLFRQACEHKATGRRQRGLWVSYGMVTLLLIQLWLFTLTAGAVQSWPPPVASWVERNTQESLSLPSDRLGGRLGQRLQHGNGEGPDNSSADKSQAVEAGKCVFSNPNRAEADPGSASRPWASHSVLLMLIGSLR